jgi:hypothetical protein
MTALLSLLFWSYSILICWELREKPKGRAGIGSPLPNHVVCRRETLLGGRDDADDATPAPGTEEHGTRLKGEQRVVIPPTDVDAGVEVRAALPNDDLAGVDQLAAEALDAEALTL